MSQSTADDFYGQQIALFRQKQQDWLRQAKELGELIEHLTALRNGSQSRSEPTMRPVEPGEYKGWRVVRALETYLRARRGTKIPLPRVVEDLLAGGVEPGKPRGKRTAPAALVSQTIKIALPNNDRVFAWEPRGSLSKVDENTIFVWLAPGADEVKPRKRYPQKSSREMSPECSGEGSAAEG